MNPGEQASMNFDETLKELLLSFDRKQWRPALESWVRTEATKYASKDITEDGIQDILEIAFVMLIQRGAIAPVRPLSARGQKQLDALMKIWGPAAETFDGRRTTETKVAEADPLDTIANEFNTMPAGDFKASLFTDGQPNERHKLFDQACAAGRI